METQFEQMRTIARTIAAAAPMGANDCTVQFANYFPEIGATVLCVGQIIPAGNEHRGQTGRIALAVLDETRDVDEQFAALRREAAPRTCTTLAEYLGSESDANELLCRGGDC